MLYADPDNMRQIVNAVCCVPVHDKIRAAVVSPPNTRVLPSPQLPYIVYPKEGPKPLTDREELKEWARQKAAERAAMADAANPQVFTEGRWWQFWRAA